MIKGRFPRSVHRIIEIHTGSFRLSYSQNYHGWQKKGDGRHGLLLEAAAPVYETALAIVAILRGLMELLNVARH